MYTSNQGCHISKDGKTIKRSSNLRCILDYARLSPVRSIETRPLVNTIPGIAPSGMLHVTYADGATTGALFACHAVLMEWVHARRSWRGASWLNVHGSAHATGAVETAL